ncbi:uncharacterized protein [Haliotis cracherodii]|uniref:uncharacterized protein n=1 Tax=Haliotis cracherodii TaxID=6455 RepID=UPI0039EA7479
MTMMLTLTLQLLGCCISTTAAVKFWSSGNPLIDNMWRNGWNIHQDTYIGGESVSVSPNPDGSNNKVYDISFSQGSYAMTGPNSGLQFYASPVAPRECVTLQYKVLFPTGFDFAYGGKLPGLYGGGVNCTAGGDPGKDCFTSRLIWRTAGMGGISLFAPDVTQQGGFCSSPDVDCNQDWGHKTGGNSFYFDYNTWYTLLMTVRLNTPGQADGYIRLSANGLGKLFDVTGVTMRNAADVQIDGIIFSSFFGGNSACSASPVDQNAYVRLFLLKDNYC